MAQRHDSDPGDAIRRGFGAHRCQHTPMGEFTTLALNEALLRGLREVGYVAMTPVQAASLPAILEGRDVAAEAGTGSGKTAAFALGLLARLDPQRRALQGLVLCPTRELADQISREIRRLARFIPNVKVLTLYGGVALRPQLASLAHEPHIVVGTPGRLVELIAKGALPLRVVKVLVLDEADRMLDMGFADELGRILGATPETRQTLLFSATISPEIRDLGRRLQKDPIDVAVETPAEEVTIEQAFFEVHEEQKLRGVEALLLTHRPEAAVVFCNTRHEVRTVSAELETRGFSVLALHGELEQRERDEMLVQFANRSCTVLVASDVAGRGLDIADLPMVVNYDVANDADTHLHRIGRTGRAGRKGLALTLAAPTEARRVALISERLGAPLDWRELPRPSVGDGPFLAPFVTLVIDAGRQDKLRPGDLLGALTGTAGLPASAVGKIDLFPTRTYVAIARDAANDAFQRLRSGKIKGRTFRVRRLGG
jgi:ATP-independent RNA helicase DbpA